MMHGMDAAVGRVVDALRERGMYEDAVIVFMSDNGGESRPNHAANNFPLRGQKVSLLEVRTFSHFSVYMRVCVCVR